MITELTGFVQMASPDGWPPKLEKSHQRRKWQRSEMYEKQMLLRQNDLCFQNDSILPAKFSGFVTFDNIAIWSSYPNVPSYQ